MKKAGFNIIDLSFALQAQTKRRNRDGIHWSPAENRLMTNIILTHLTLTLPSLGPRALPGRMKESASLTRLIQSSRYIKKKETFGKVKKKVKKKYIKNDFTMKVDWKANSLQNSEFNNKMMDNAMNENAITGRIDSEWANNFHGFNESNESFTNDTYPGVNDYSNYHQDFNSSQGYGYYHNEQWLDYNSWAMWHMWQPWY